MFACITTSITALFPVNDPQELGVWELYDTSRGTKISLDELACRPGVLASSCTGRVFHSPAAQLRCRSSTRQPGPAPRAPARSSPQPAAPSPGARAAAALARVLKRPRRARCALAPQRRGVRRCQRASDPRRREIPQYQTQTQCRPDEPRWEEHLCPVTSSYWCSKDPVAAFVRRMSFPECLEVISTTKWLGLRNRGEILHAQGCVLGKWLHSLQAQALLGSSAQAVR